MENRIIKFRAWDKVMNDFVPEKYICLTADGTCENNSTENCSFDPKYWELMQFAGLLDCDGNEIFEGDIIEGESYLYGYQLHDGKQFKYKGVVKFQTQCDVGLCWVVDDGSGCWNLNQTVHRNAIDYSTGKIIGNIYQNPNGFAEAGGQN